MHTGLVPYIYHTHTVSVNTVMGRVHVHTYSAQDMHSMRSGSHICRYMSIIVTCKVISHFSCDVNVVSPCTW